MREYIIHHTITTHVEADNQDNVELKARELDLIIITAVQDLRLPHYVDPDIIIEHRVVTP